MPEGCYRPKHHRGSQDFTVVSARITRCSSRLPNTRNRDEATSALDPNAERIVQEALDNVSKSRTTLIIAHKLSTVQKAYNIAVMSQGAVVEQGTHHELLMRNGAYARLVRAQSLEQGQQGNAQPRRQAIEENGPVGVEEEDEGLMRSETKKSGKLPDEEEGQQTAREEMGYSLVECLFLLVREQPRWWPLYATLAFISLLAGKSPAFLEDVLRADALIRWHMARHRRAFLPHVRHIPAGGQCREIRRQLLGLDGEFVNDLYRPIQQMLMPCAQFFVVAIGNLIIYFSIGVTCNNIVQV